MSSFLLERHNVSKADIPLLGGIFVVATIVWFALYFISQVVMNTWQRHNKNYHRQSNEDKAMYLARIVAIIHAVVAFLYAFITIFFTWYLATYITY
jgi:Na+-transporting methylmalonyl-CoA/oxaloacetate decarboxylase gamma subunit